MAIGRQAESAGDLQAGFVLGIDHQIGEHVAHGGEFGIVAACEEEDSREDAQVFLSAAIVEVGWLSNAEVIFLDGAFLVFPDGGQTFEISGSRLIVFFPDSGIEQAFGFVPPPALGEQLRFAQD